MRKKGRVKTVPPGGKGPSAPTASGCRGYSYSGQGSSNPFVHLHNSRINGQLKKSKNQTRPNATSPEHSPVYDYFEFRGFLSPTLLPGMNTAFINNWTSHGPSIL